jgi:hypothetical protein
MRTHIYNNFFFFLRNQIFIDNTQKMVYGVTYVEEGDETGGVGNSPNNQVAFSPQTPLGGNGHGSDETEYEFPWAS